MRAPGFEPWLAGDTTVPLTIQPQISSLIHVFLKHKFWLQILLYFGPCMKANTMCFD